MPRTDLPDKKPVPADKQRPKKPAQRLDRRTAVAQARAIRREAAAKAETDKAHAARTANTILEHAEPAPPKKPMHRQTEPVPVSNPTGKFDWLDDAKRSSKRADAEELVEQLLQESKQRRRRRPAREQDPERLEQIIAETGTGKEQAVAKVLAEQKQSSTEPESPAAEAPLRLDDVWKDADARETPAEAVNEAVETPDFTAEEPEAEEIAAEPAETVTEAPAAESSEDTDAQQTQVFMQKWPSADEPAEAETEVPQTAVNPNRTAEEQVKRELRRLSQREPKMSAQTAESDYTVRMHRAAPEVRQQAKKSEKQWSKKAAVEQAKITGERAGRVTARWNVFICLGLLFSIAVCMLVLERPVMSEIENRMLATMPEWSVENYISGKYTNGVANYYNDTVPHRSDFKAMTQTIRKHLGLSGGPVIHGGVPEIPKEPVTAESTTAVTEKTEPAVTETTNAAAVPEVTTTAKDDPEAEVTTTEATDAPEEPANDEPEKEGEISNNILIVNKRGIMLFGGWEGMGEPYANILNRYKEDLPNVNMYSMVVPTVCSYYTPDEFQYLITSEKANIDHINSCLVGVEPVDAYSALGRHTEEPIFMRTDHHWSGLGAFYAAEEFSKVARVPFAGIEEYDQHVQPGYVGTLYGYSNDIILKENPEDFIWYTPKANYTTTYYNSYLQNPFESPYFIDINTLATVSWYLVYMIGDDHMVKLTTDVHNGRKLCIMKDSYGNALAPWLTSSFEEIYIMDMRYFHVNAVQAMKDWGITDLLFAMNTFSANGGNAQKMEEIRVQ